ncbi:HAMP domain-containing histidine kinase [bacterium]|nr:HAMP domain-containing histidine kinase [bacterium]
MVQPSRRRLPVRSANRDDAFACFMGDVVHRLKNKLGGIHGFADLLQKELPEDDPRLRYVQRIQSGVDQVDEMFVRLMKLFRTPELRREKIELTDRLAAAAGRVTGLSGRTAGVDFPEKIRKAQKVRVTGDPDVLDDTLFHLLDFTCQTAETVWALTVSAPDGRPAAVTIRYELPENGLPENRSDRISELLRNAQPVEARISLAVADRLCRLLGGRLKMEAPDPRSRCLLLQIKREI